MIDPYQAMSFQGRFNYPKFDEYCDFAVITHEHLDHNYTQDLKGNPVIVRNSWHDERLTIRSIFAWHDKYQGTKFGGYVLMKIIEADNIRLCHMGDCGEMLSDQTIDQMGKIDILLIPVGGFYTINGTEAVDLVKRIRPKSVIPCHYLTPRCSLKLEDEKSFLSYFENIQYLSGEIEAGQIKDGIVHLTSRY